MVIHPLHVFVSYKSEYRDLAIPVRDALQLFGHKTWLRQDNIPKEAKYFPDEIQKGLEACDIVIGILTEKALKSREVLGEWGYALSRYDEKRLLLLRYEAVGLPDWLAGIQCIDCTINETDAFDQLQKALINPDPDQSTPHPAPNYIRRPNTSSKKNIYHPPRLREKSKIRRRVAWLVILILLLVAGIAYLADGQMFTLAIGFMAFIPAIVVLMPAEVHLEYGSQDTTQPQDENRHKMLYNIYQTWIQGALHPNLPEEETIALDVDLQPEAVLTHTDYPDYTLPNSQEIDKIFDDLGGELIILGDPGSGKTILLLQLAEHLLGQAQHDEKKSIPAVFNLSSWGRDQEPLDVWLVDELRRSYGVPRRTGKDWVKGKLALPLDGLDEIAPAANIMQGAEEAELSARAIALRSACIDAINMYRTHYPYVNLVVCSRSADYEALQKKLDLHAAIRLRGLKDNQIEAYLAGDDYAGVRELIMQEKAAHRLARTPFLLTMIKTTYAGIPYKGSPFKQLKLDNTEKRQTDLLDSYVEQQIPAAVNLRPNRDHTLGYLRWLAWQMVKHKISIFYIEDLQPHWAKNQLYYRLVFGLLGGLFGSLFLDLEGGPLGGSLGNLLGGLFLGLIVSLMDVEFAEKVTWSLGESLKRENMIFRLITSLLGGLFFGLSSGLITPLLGGLMIEANLNVRTRPNIGLQLSLQNGLIASLLGGLFFGLLGSLIVGLIVGLFFSLFFGLIVGWLPIIQHIVLRLILAHEGIIPRWRYDRFLDDCVQFGLLRKIGGGYIFRHRILLEYFAQQYERHNAAKDQDSVS